MRRIGLAVTLIAGLAAVPAQADTLNLVVQPVYTPERSREVYQPLVEYLNRATSHTINLVTPKNFHQYWADMRRENEWHLVFDDAHFTDYRIDKYGYEPLVRTAEDAQFSLLIGSSIMEEDKRALIARRVVSMPAPSMGFVLLAKWYENPLQQPVIVSSAASWRDTVEIVFAMEAEGAMVPNWLAQRYPNLLPVAESEAYPGAAISASPEVSAEARAEIRDALLALHEDEKLYVVLDELNISQFQPATAEEYAGSKELLKTTYGY